MTEKKKGLGSMFTEFFTETVEVKNEPSNEKQPVDSKSAQDISANIATILGRSNENEKTSSYKNNNISNSPSISEGRLDNNALIAIVERLKAEDQPGPDFLELFTAVQEMIKEGMEMPNAIKSAFITLKATGQNKLTKKVIDDSFAFYLNVIDSEKNNFISAYNTAIGKLINEPKKRIENLEAENTNIDKQIADLQNKKSLNLQSIADANREITTQSAKLESTKNDYSFTINYFTNLFREVYNNTSSLK